MCWKMGLTSFTTGRNIRDGRAAPRPEAKRRERRQRSDGKSAYAQAMPGHQSSNAPSPSPSPDKSIRPKCPHQKIIELYHINLPALPIVQNHSKDLKDRLRARWREDPERQNLDWWEWYFENVSKCDFLVGKVKSWAASFYWLTGPKNMTKVLNGEYVNRDKLSKTDQAIEGFLNER